MTGSLLLTAYRAATALLGPLAMPLLRWRERAGKEDGARIRERLGHASRMRPPGRIAWVHGASVGEGLALLPLIEALVGLGFHVLVTTGTVTSSRVMAARIPAGATHQFVPIDLPRPMRRFLSGWNPDLVLLAESELWPNLMFEVRRFGAPLILVNARLSERSFRRWARARGAIGDLLAEVDLCLAQSEGDAARFRALGATRVEVAGNLKFDVAPPPAGAELLSDMRGRIGARPVWVAASTHPEEEGPILDAHRAVAGDLPGVLTIIVPRHPSRGQPLVDAAKRRGLAVAQRSHDDRLGPDTEVYVGDTVGELGLFFRVADLVFLGKSLAGAGGGQNPIEPAKLGCAILHGRHVRNFEGVYRLLDEADAAFCVDRGEDLAEEVSRLLSDVATLRRMSRAAAEAVEQQCGATARIMAALQPFLPAPDPIR